jgi:mannose-6-phosphate isomerase-like protein (cupin superfamily)
VVTRGPRDENFTSRRIDISGDRVTQIGALDEWRAHVRGFDRIRSRDGRRTVDHELTMQYVALSANALKPGEGAGYWHAHSRVEELYVLLEGCGQMGVGDEAIDVGPGSVVRVGQNV